MVCTNMGRVGSSDAFADKRMLGGLGVDIVVPLGG
jgi:hypothetical protein